MTTEGKAPDRRQYEERGIAIPAVMQGRTPAEATLSDLQKQLVKRYGEGWEVDRIYPGSICDAEQDEAMTEGHMVIFKRRRQLRDE